MKKKKYISIILLVLITSITAKSQTAEWTVLSSAITFKIKNAGINTNGHFKGLSAKIIFDATKGYGNSIDATIDATTINTNSSSRDGHLKKEEFFDILKYGTINLKATLFSKEANGTYKGFFKLTLRNMTKDVVIPFTFTENNGKGVFKGSFTINRLDYGVGTSSMILSDNTTINLEVYVLKK